jgi:hypothetical protein
VPVGVTGEIFIGGAGVARGYLNRPELTVERFVCNPFRADPGTHLYRTGDRARYCSDGNIVYLGRIDNQVKIRGCRVELGEIEAALNQHPEVKESAVVVREVTQTDERRLLAYFVSKTRSSDIDDLQTFLKDKLPIYMVPAQFIELGTLPLTPTGKLDHRALPLPNSIQSKNEREFVAPRTEIEELMGQVWRDVLNIEKLGIFDNFFELGGHSLLGIQIVARLCETFGRDIPLAALFDAPTVAALSETILKLMRDSDSPTLPPILPVPRDGRLIPLSMNQEHLWRLDQVIPGTPYFNIPYVYWFPDGVNLDALKKALKQIVERHEALRTVFSERDGRPCQIIASRIKVSVPVDDLRNLDPKDCSSQAAQLVVSDRSKPFNLAIGPLFRFRIIHLTGSRSLLLITMHHIVSDFWSMEVFRRELDAFYGVFNSKRPLMLPNPTIQFADYAVWERNCIENGLFAHQQQYWNEQLESGSNGFGHDLPADKLSFEMQREAIDFDETLFSMVKATAQKEGISPFMLITASLFITLHLLTKQEDIRVGILIANRVHKSTEGLIGHFLNTVVLRLSLRPCMTYRELMSQVRHKLFEVYSHSQIPFEQIARAIEHEHKTDRRSLFSVLLSYQHLSHSRRSFSELEIEPLTWRWPSRFANIAVTSFDLILTVKELPHSLVGDLNCKRTFVIDPGDSGELLKSIVTTASSDPTAFIDQWPMTKNI